MQIALATQHDSYATRREESKSAKSSKIAPQQRDQKKTTPLPLTLPTRTPGIKKNGSGLTRAKLFIRTCSASLPTPAGARTWGTSKSPNCEVSIPAASTNLGGDGARLDSERKVPRSVLSSRSRLPRIEVCRTPTGCLDSRRILPSFISQTVVLVVPVSTAK